MIGPTRRSKKGGWTEEEDKTLANAVQKYNGKNWKKIAECIPDRTDVQCLHRWQKVLNPELVKGPWTKEEDDQIIEMVEKWGNKKWSEIAKYLPGRIGKQCRERWHNHLNPDIKKTAWTKEEELILIKAHNIYGNKWAEIAKILHGRTENSIKNHWNCSIRKKLEYSSQTGGSRNPEEVKQTLDRRVNSERSFNLCSLDLGHGASMSRESHLQSSVEDVFEKRGDIMTKSPSINISHRRDVDSCLLNSSRCQRTAEDIAMLGESHDMIANLPNKLCSSSSSDVAKIPVFYGIQTHKPGDGIDLLPSRSLSGSLQACLSTPVYGKPALAVTTDKRLFKPSSDQQGNTSSAIDFGQSNSKLIGQPDNSVSTTMKYEGRNHAGACENLGNRNRAGFLCYKPLQQEDMNIFLETGKFPSTDSYIQAASSSISCCTDSSTDSILTSLSSQFENTPSLSSQFENTPSLSSQFENTPSIIRKRRVFDRQSGNANHRKDIYSQKERLNNDPQFRRPHPYSEYAVSSKLQLKSQKRGTSSAIKSVEKRLEHVFDVEWNTTRAISRTSNADSI